MTTLLVKLQTWLRRWHRLALEYWLSWAMGCPLLCYRPAVFLTHTHRTKVKFYNNHKAWQLDKIAIAKSYLSTWYKFGGEHNKKTIITRVWNIRNTPINIIAPKQKQFQNVHVCVFAFYSRETSTIAITHSPAEPLAKKIKRTRMITIF